MDCTSSSFVCTLVGKSVDAIILAHLPGAVTTSAMYKQPRVWQRDNQPGAQLWKGSNHSGA